MSCLHCRSFLLLVLQLVTVWTQPSAAFLPSSSLLGVRTARISMALYGQNSNHQEVPTLSMSFWHRLFPPSPVKKDEKLDSLQARLDVLEHQSRLDVTALQKRMNESIEEQQQRARPRYSGTWTVEFTNATAAVQCTPAYYIGGLPFRLIMTKNTPVAREDNDIMDCCSIGLYLEYLGLSESNALASPCVQCRFTLVEPLPENGRPKNQYESLPTTLDGDGGALGVDVFARIPAEQHAHVRMAFEVTLCSVHFPGTIERAEAEARGWERTYQAVEARLKKTLMEVTSTNTTTEGSAEVWAPSTLFTRQHGEEENNDTTVQDAEEEGTTPTDEE